MNRDTSEFVNSVFEQPWWLDVVAPNKWEEIFVKENGEIIARWPIVYKFRGIGMPKMTQTLGFWLSENIKNSDPYYIKRKRITNLLVDQLPKHKNIKIRLNPIVDYFLPMYWKHYIISPYISYRIIDLTDINDVYKRFNRIVKGNIRSANNKMIVKAIDDIEILLMLMDKTFSLQNRKNPFSRALVRNIYIACKKYNSGKLLYAMDRDGNACSGVFLVYDNNVCYALIGGTDPKFRSTGAFSLLLWEGIKFATTVSKSFDFQGSMIEGIENFIKQFGGTPIVYYQVQKQNVALQFLDFVKPMIKSLIGYKQ